MLRQSLSWPFGATLTHILCDCVPSSSVDFGVLIRGGFINDTPSSVVGGVQLLDNFYN